MHKRLASNSIDCVSGALGGESFEMIAGVSSIAASHRDNLTTATGRVDPVLSFCSGPAHIEGRPDETSTLPSRTSLASAFFFFFSCDFAGHRP
jgi:hypothetical protein